MNDQLLAMLKDRFACNMRRHQGIEWDAVEARLRVDASILRAVGDMERTGGEPDVVIFQEKSQPYLVDCSPESPAGRRRLCFDRKG